MVQLNPNNARPVRIVDESGNIVSSFGSGGTLAAAGKQTLRTATAAGAQDIAAANPSRASFSFTNAHATVTLRVKEGAEAGAASGIPVMPGGTYWADTQDRISVCPESGSADAVGYEVNV